LALATLFLLAPAPAPASAADAPDGCVPVARIVSIQGSVQIQRNGQSAWTVVRKLDTVVCQGDVLHAGPRSRAALLIDPETLVRLDQSSTLSIRQTPDETIVEFTKDPGLFQRVVTAPNPCGAGYFISRFPRKFRVLTPFVNASVEGTEFLVAMRCESALVAVFEGRVRAEEVLAAASFSLKEGETVEAGVGQPAAMKLMVKPVDAVQWALYYPPLTEAAG
jgi:ferric-dicitrate binding protein FerR (iron transport regulator)